MKIRMLAAVAAALVVAVPAHALVTPSSGSVPQGAFAAGVPSVTPSSSSAAGETPAVTVTPPSVAEMLRSMDLAFMPVVGSQAQAPTLLAGPAELPDVGVQAVPEPGAPAVVGLALAMAALVSRRARRRAR